MPRLALPVLFVLCFAISESMANVANEAAAKEICKALGVENRYFNFKKYKKCIDGTVGLLSKMTAKDITEKLPQMPNFGMETTLHAVGLFHEHQWQNVFIKYMCDGIQNNKDLDIFSRQQQLTNIVTYADFPWWQKWMNADYRKEFLLFSVIDSILQKKDFKDYMDVYHTHLTNKDVLCTTGVAMDVFTFLNDYENNPNKQTPAKKRGMTSKEYLELLKATCAKENNWTEENLSIIFTKTGLLDTTFRNVELFMINVPSVSKMADLQKTGFVEGYTVDLVVPLTERCQGMAVCHSNVLVTIGNSLLMGIGPPRFKHIMDRTTAKNVPQYGYEVFVIIQKLSSITEADKKGKFFRDKDSDAVTDLIFHALDHQRIVEDWAKTETSMRRVFNRAYSQNWPVETMNVGWKALNSLAALFDGK